MQLHPDLEKRRRFLRECINGCVPRLSDIQFAKTQLYRHPRTLRRWLDGQHPIPWDVFERLKVMREYQKRKARETARDEVSFAGGPVVVHREIAAAGVQPRDIDPGLGRYPRGPSINTTSPVRHEQSQPPKRKWVPAVEQLAAADAKRAAAAAPIGAFPAPPFEAYAAEYWLCACSKPDRYRTWRKMAVAVCDRCGYARPESAAAMQASGPTSSPRSRPGAISRTAPKPRGA